MSPGAPEFLRACALDVAVRKAGNVSVQSAGHRMEAAMFTTSARAAVGPLFTPGASIGERVAGAVSATARAVGCNTNLGIVLLCAPLAAALEAGARLARILDAATLADTRAVYRAIAGANPGGLGRAEAEDVHAEPTLPLRAAMTLAADRDSIARQYRDAFADVFELAGVAEAGMLRVYLEALSRWPDSHIVRKHGEAAAHTVLATAQGFLARCRAGEPVEQAPDYVAWDEALKAGNINPGTSADLAVAAMFVHGTERDTATGLHQHLERTHGKD